MDSDSPWYSARHGAGPDIKVHSSQSRVRSCFGTRFRGGRQPSGSGSLAAITLTATAAPEWTKSAHGRLDRGEDRSIDPALLPRAQIHIGFGIGRRWFELFGHPRGHSREQVFPAKPVVDGSANTLLGIGTEVVTNSVVKPMPRIVQSEIASLLKVAQLHRRGQMPVLGPGNGLDQFRKVVMQQLVTCGRTRRARPSCPIIA